MEGHLRSVRSEARRGGRARVAGTLLGLVGGFALGYALVRTSGVHHRGYVILSLTSFEGLIFAYLSTPYLVDGWRGLDRRLKATPISDLVAGVLGLISGLVVAVLIGYFVRAFPYGVPVSAALAGVMGLAGGSLGLHRREELGALPTGRTGARAGQIRGALVDTSAIIDGRILDVAKAGFLYMPLMIPRFVLRELQLVADAADETKRARGRRGLEVLSRLQRETDAAIQFVDDEGAGEGDADARLVRIARRSGWAILTNDYNLDRVARIEGATVLNMNELSTAVKPLAIPGDEIRLELVKEGKSAAQGIGYLDDGTMVVVENGRRHLGERVAVTVSSVLQTPAGRMIFAQIPGLGRRPRRAAAEETTETTEAP
ncbi:MAG: PIN/TRAM domain-containing protein [Candidatus Dormibacterales bacterium]